MAVSCEAIHSEDSKKSSDGLYYETAGLVAAQLFESRDELNLPLGKILNVNVPSVPATSLKGVVTAALGRRTYHHKMIDYKDPRGRSAFWIGDVPDFIPDDGTDCVAVHEGYVSLTILKPSYEDTVLTNELNHNSLEKRIMERVTKL